MLPLVRARNSVGTRSGSDVQLSGDGIDELQGRIEYHDDAWQYHHESRRFPSLLDGQPCSRAVLAHGARLTFGKRIHVTLLGPGLMRTKRRWLLWLLLLLLATISAVVAVIALRPDLL